MSAPPPGISFFNHPAEETLALAQRADALGFGSVWLADHVLTPGSVGSTHPYPGQGRGRVIGEQNSFSSPLLMAAAIAATTSRIAIATGVLIVPLRHPLLIARDLITAAEIAPGRIVLGAGAGWLAEEFEALDVPFKQRTGRLEESIEILREVFQGGVAEHSGKRFSFAPVTLTNEPLEIPIVLGGTSEPALRRAALLGDGWYSPGGQELDDCRRFRTEIEAIREAAGLAGNYRLIVRVNPPTPETAARFREAGFDELVLDGEHLFGGLRDAPLERKLEALERAAEEYLAEAP